jgi:hypothetical protein
MTALAVEYTDKVRRSAVWAFPSAVLLHLLFTYGVWSDLVVPSLVATGLLALGGFLFRWLRSASAVLLVASAFFWVQLVYVIGVAPTIAYLALSGRNEWLPWAPLGSIALLLCLLATRVRATMRDEWAAPLDQTPGVHVRRDQKTLWREEVERPQGPIVRAVLAMLLVFAPALFFSYGTGLYPFILFVLVSHSTAALTTAIVAWWVAYAIAVRRWEISTGTTLHLPPLRRPRMRQASASTSGRR